MCDAYYLYVGMYVYIGCKYLQVKDEIHTCNRKMEF